MSEVSEPVGELQQASAKLRFHQYLIVPGRAQFEQETPGFRVDAEPLAAWLDQTATDMRANGHLAGHNHALDLARQINAYTQATR